MPKISQEELERERLTAAIDALRTQMRELLLEHPPEGPTHMLEIFKREKSGFAMSDAWRLARERTLAERGVAKAAADAMFKNSSIAKSLNDAISDILDAMIVVRTAQRMPLFTNTARVRLVKLLSTETVSSYTNYFAPSRFSDSFIAFKIELRFNLIFVNVFSISTTPTPTFSFTILTKSNSESTSS